MAKNTEPKSWLCSGDELFGQQMETKFLTAMEKLGVPQVPPEFRKKDPRNKKSLAIARATTDEDAKGVDFWLYIPQQKIWFPIDLTTTNDHDKLNKKMEKERKYGVRLLHLDPKTIELASLGAELYLNKISQSVLALFTEDRGIKT